MGLQRLPANDVVVDDNDTFNDEPQHPVFPVIGGFTAVLFDFETTSLGASIAHILELALLHMHEEKIHSGKNLLALSTVRSLHWILSNNVTLFRLYQSRCPLSSVPDRKDSLQDAWNI